MASLGHRLAKLRKLKGWEQKDVASQLGVSRSTVAGWETDRREPSLDQLKTLAALFETTVDYLAGEKSVQRLLPDFGEVETLGERIRRMRKELRYTAHTLAGMMGLPVATIYAFENGKHAPTPEQIEELAIYLHTTPDYLQSKVTNPSREFYGDIANWILAAAQVHGAVPFDISQSQRKELVAAIFQILDVLMLYITRQWDYIAKRDQESP